MNHNEHEKISEQPTLLARSYTVRVLLIIVGSVSLGLGVLGAFLPILPTTSFVLLAAACYARASPRFYNALIRNRWFGRIILDWRCSKSVSKRVKGRAVILFLVTYGVSIFLLPHQPTLILAMIALGLVLLFFLLRLPTRDEPPEEQPRFPALRSFRGLRSHRLH